MSTYFHMITFNRTIPLEGQGVDKNVMAILPDVCQRIAIRYIVFAGLMRETATLFWYEDSMNDPVEWHYQFLAMAGVQLPASEVLAISLDTSREGRPNPHPGGGEISKSRTWKDEVSPDLLEGMDDMMRLWLPSVLLARWGVPPKVASP